MVEFEYSPAYYEECAEVKPVSLYEWRLDAAKVHVLATAQAERLSKIHAGIRVVIDGAGEYAITCNDCGLWAHFSRKMKNRRDTVNDESGALLDVVDCNALNLHQIFGEKVLRDEDEAWNGYTGWDFEPVLNWDHLAGYTDLRGAKKAHWMAKRKVWKDEESTEEPRSGDWIDWVLPD